MKRKMPHKYSTALSHIVLAGTGIYCCVRHHGHNTFHLSCATFGIIITNSVIGIWRWGNPDHGDKVEKPYNHTFFLQTIFAMPCIAGQVWLNSGYERIIGFLHPMLSIIPLTAYVAGKSKPEIIDLLIFLNILSCAAISYQTNNNCYGIAAAVAFAINHFYIDKQDSICDVPGRDFYNYALCFFTYFSYRAVI